MWAKQFNSFAALEKGQADFPGSPDLVLIFGDADRVKQNGMSQKLAQRWPDAVQLACSTGSTVCGPKIMDNGFSALAMGFDSTRVAVEVETIHKIEESREIGRALGRRLAAPDLAGVHLMTDGLVVNGSALIGGLQDIIGSEAEISGGMAGDGERFEETQVVLNGVVKSGTIAAIGFYGRSIRFAHGCIGGWDAFGPRRKITASAGSVLHQLDDRPALDLYETYLGEEAADLPASGLIYPLKIWDPAKPDDQFVRTLLGIDREAKSLLLAGDVPEGWHAQLMRGSIDRLIDGAARAARDASQAMAAQGVAPAACLLVSCVGRRLLMGQSTEEEIEQVHEAIGPGVPMAGYYSYGEIAPRAGSKVAGLHNQTLTLTLLAEVA